jgi:4-methylaminobutanoate oxidase (formaldehyde-forming)
MTAFGNTSSTSTEIRMYTRDLFPRLEAETGMSTGFRRCGLVEALDESRMEEYRRAAIFQRRLGLESHEVSPKEMEELFPFAQMDGLVGGFWVPVTAGSTRST